MIRGVVGANSGDAGGGILGESIPGMHGLEQQPQSGVGRVFSRLGGLQDTAQLLNTPPSTYIHSGDDPFSDN